MAAQRQKREELELFRQLFKEFNARYDAMNARLYAILEGPEDGPFSPEERNLLFDYFNLCGEEYMYYAHGYIYPEVWDAWRHGMSIFRKSRRIRTLWDKDLGTGSYYGLIFDNEEPEKEAPGFLSETRTTTTQTSIAVPQPEVR